MHSVLENTANRFPEKTAVNESSWAVTYRQLNSDANRVALALKGLDVAGQRIVGIYLDASIEYVVAILGVLKSGAVFLPLNIRFPDRRLASILEKTKPVVIVTNIGLENELIRKLQNPEVSVSPSHLLVMKDKLNFDVKRFPNGNTVAMGPEFPENNPPLMTEPDDGCYIFATSGSTGEPKAIFGRQKGLSHFIRWEIDELGLNEDVKVSMLSPVTFDVSLRDIFVPLIAGGTLFIPDEVTMTNSNRLFKWLQEYNITLIHIIPTLFRLLTREIKELGSDGDPFPKLKYALIAGEILYGNDVINWRKVAGNRVELINVYGPSETTLAKMFYPIKNESFESKEIIPIGKPISDTEILVIKDRRLCSIGEIGEIYIKTPFMSKGYYKDPELNTKSFIQNPTVTDREEIVYKTGDFGHYMPDGNLRFVGRHDSQIKLRGIRIEIGEIEVALSQHPQVQQAAVAVKDDASENQRLMGYVVPQPGNTLAVEPLRRFLVDKLPDYMIPDLFVNLEALPLTHSGKVDRRSLPEPGRARPEMEEAYVPPSTDMERTLSEIWCQVLSLERVGVNDNFFDLGGNSLLSVQLCELLERGLIIDLPVTKLFQYPNIRLLAKYLSGSQKDQPSYDKFQSRAQRRTTAISHRRRIKERR